MDLMCGVHCVNALLQGKAMNNSGPYYNEVTLANIALELDAKEKALMSEHGETADLRKYLKEESGNVAENGNYSIQVISEALSRLGGLTITSVEAVADKSSLPKEDGFICNSSSHWFTIRQVDGIWYNLNSTNRKMPEIVSEFYLSAFLMAIK
jgi:ataxin-3